MDFLSLLVAAALFVAFVPGILVTLPPKGSKSMVLLVHAVLFALVTHFVMRMIHERFGNYGPAGVPPGWVVNQDGMARPDPSCRGPHCVVPGQKIIPKK
jgi:hypothetical protein